MLPICTRAKQNTTKIIRRNQNICKTPTNLLFKISGGLEIFTFESKSYSNDDIENGKCQSDDNINLKLEITFEMRRNSHRLLQLSTGEASALHYQD